MIIYIVVCTTTCIPIRSRDQVETFLFIAADAKTAVTVVAVIAVLQFQV